MEQESIAIKIQKKKNVLEIMNKTIDKIALALGWLAIVFWMLLQFGAKVFPEPISPDVVRPDFIPLVITGIILVLIAKE